jgi:hypothetical protein
MGFTIPNYTNAVATGVGDQAEPDSVDFQILGNSSNGVVFDLTNYATNGVVTKTSTTSNSVNIAPYKVRIDGIYYHNDSTTITVALDGGDANKRFDLVVIPKATPLVPTFRKGTSSSTNPEFPVLVDGDIVLAAIYRSGSGSAGFIDTPNIVDKRFFISSNTTWINANEPTLTANSDGAKAANGDIWITTANAAFGKSSVWLKVAGAWENLAKYTAISSANTANNIVIRDASGNFSAGTITASLTGNVSGNVSGSSGSTTGNAATATNANNANTVANLAVHGGRNNEANKVVRTDGNGYLQTGYINAGGAPYDENTDASPDRIWGSNAGGDAYLRTYRTSALNVSTAGYATNAGSATTAVSLAGNGLNFGYSSPGVIGTVNSMYIGGTLSVGNISSAGTINIPYIGSYTADYGNGTPFVRVSNGALRQTASKREYKNSIEDVQDGLSIISSLRPRYFKWNERESDPEFEKEINSAFRDVGFIAEEVFETSAELVFYEKSKTTDENGQQIDDPNGELRPTMWKANAVIAMLVKAVQELSAKVEALEAR